MAHWPARAVEFYRRTVVAAHLDHLHPARMATPDLHSARHLADLDTPFDNFCHIGDVRRISNDESGGRYGIPNVGLFAWRLRPYSVTKTAAYCREEVGAHCFTFSALGNDTQLFQNPIPEIERSAIARAENLPVPITRWALENKAPADAGRAQADSSLYGPGASLVIQAEGWPKAGNITYDQVIPADLSDWSYRVPKQHVAIDPVLGRIAFSPSQPPRRGVTVSYRYGFAMDIGGGEYRRTAAPLPTEVQRLRVEPNATAGSGVYGSIADAYAAWRHARDTAVATTSAATTPPALVIELLVSSVYVGRFSFELLAGETIAVVAAPGTRPVIWLPDTSAGTTDSISIRGTRGSRAILDGLLIAGRAVEIGNADPPPDDKADIESTKAPPVTTVPVNLCEVWIRHCTLVPGNSLHPNCDPRQPSEPSVLVDRTSACLRVESSIIGAIRIEQEDGAREPGKLLITDSIVDATSESRTAIGGFGAQIGHVELSVWRSTLVGRVAVHALRYAEDSIFVSRLDVARRQVGCVRFCYITEDSRTPRRYECQPDGALAAADAAITPQAKSLPPAEFAALKARQRVWARLRVTPRFESIRYGSATYLRLTACVAPEISQGAHDESEMGVYHDLFEHQRLSMLSDRLADFVPASSDAAVIFVS